MMRRGAAAFAVSAVCVWAAGAGVGCAPALPRYPVMGAEESLGVVAGRMEGVRSVSARCDISVEGRDGQGVRLDGALAMEMPDRLRVRAWKFDQVVLDLTVVGEEAWVLMREGEGEGAGENGGLGRLREVPARRIGEVFALLGPGYFRGARVDEERTTGEVLVVVGEGMGAGDEVVCEVERGTLTVRRFFMDEGGDGEWEGEVRLGAYREIEGVVWPTWVRISGGEGIVLIRLEDVELNRGVPEGAFVPPRRATKLP